MDVQKSGVSPEFAAVPKVEPGKSEKEQNRAKTDAVASPQLHPEDQPIDPPTPMARRNSQVLEPGKLPHQATVANKVAAESPVFADAITHPDPDPTGKTEDEEWNQTLNEQMQALFEPVHVADGSGVTQESAPDLSANTTLAPPRTSESSTNLPFISSTDSSRPDPAAIRDFQAEKNQARLAMMAAALVGITKPEKNLKERLNTIETTYQMALQKAEGNPEKIGAAKSDREREFGKEIKALKERVLNEANEVRDNIEEQYQKALETTKPEDVNALKDTRRKALIDVKKHLAQRYTNISSAILRYNVEAATRELTLCAYDRDEFLNKIKTDTTKKNLTRPDLETMQKAYWEKYKAAYRHLTNLKLKVSSKSAGSFFKNPIKNVRNWRTNAQIGLHNRINLVPLPKMKGDDSMIKVENAKFKKEKILEKMNLALQVHLINPDLFESAEQMADSWDRTDLIKFLINELGPIQKALLDQHDMLAGRYQKLLEILQNPPPVDPWKQAVAENRIAGLSALLAADEKRLAELDEKIKAEPAPGIISQEERQRLNDSIIDQRIDLKWKTDCLNDPLLPIQKQIDQIKKDISDNAVKLNRVKDSFARLLPAMEKRRQALPTEIELPRRQWASDNQKYFKPTASRADSKEQLVVIESFNEKIKGQESKIKTIKRALKSGIRPDDLKKLTKSELRDKLKEHKQTAAEMRSAMENFKILTELETEQIYLEYLSKIRMYSSELIPKGQPFSSKTDLAQTGISPLNLEQQKLHQKIINEL